MTVRFRQAFLSVNQARFLVNWLNAAADGIDAEKSKNQPAVSVNRFTHEYAIGPGWLCDEYGDGDKNTRIIAVRFSDGSGLSVWKASCVFSTIEAAEAAREKK